MGARQIFTFNKANIAEKTGNKNTREQWLHLNQRRAWATSVEQEHHRKLTDQGFAANTAALLPRDAYRELDEMTQRVFRHDEGQAFMEDLMPLSRSVPIGKTLFQYRVSNDKVAGVTRSMGGRVPENLDKVSYEFKGDPVGIFTNGTVREWREQESFSSEAFDAMTDDLESRTAEIKQDVAQYMLTGDARFSVNGFVGQGLRNHRNSKQIDLGGAGSNINLAALATTNDSIINFWVNTFGNILDQNYIMQDVNLYVSPEMMTRLQQPYAASGQFQGGTLEKYVLDLSRIGKIKRTYELTGNECFAFVPDQKYIRPLVGMAMGTFQVPRDNPFSNYQILQWGAYGLQVREDANNRAGVFNFAEA